MAQEPTQLHHTKEKPLNLGLNDGVWMPQACVDHLRGLTTRTALRHYPSETNKHLLEAISRANNVGVDHVFVQNGSGPILRQVVPHVIKSQILSSPRRVVRHAVNKSGYPVLTPRFTYGKVPSNAAKLGITYVLLPCGPENGFTVDVPDLARRLDRQDSFVYIVTPNNPTGNVMVSPQALEPVIASHPGSTFFLDEAYVEYLDPSQHSTFAPLVPRYKNLMVSRTFSFAWGLAGAHVGYLLGEVGLVQKMRSQLTGYVISKLAEDLCVAALSDKSHLPFLREETARERAFLREGLERHPGIESFPSDTHFVFCRFKDGRTGKELAERMLEKGIKIKTISAIQDHRFDEYFRITLGVRMENAWFLDKLAEVLAEWSR